MLPPPLPHVQDRLQRCVQRCQDRAQETLSASPSQKEIEKAQNLLANCVADCAQVRRWQGRYQLHCEQCCSAWWAGAFALGSTALPATAEQPGPTCPLAGLQEYERQVPKLKQDIEVKGRGLQGFPGRQAVALCGRRAEGAADPPPATLLRAGAHQAAQISRGSTSRLTRLLGLPRCAGPCNILPSLQCSGEE